MTSGCLGVKQKGNIKSRCGGGSSVKKTVKGKKNSAISVDQVISGSSAHMVDCERKMGESETPWKMEFQKPFAIQYSISARSSSLRQLRNCGTSASGCTSMRYRNGNPIVRISLSFAAFFSLFAKSRTRYGGTA